MRLEHLCDMELAYREESLYQGKVVLTRPYGSQEASAYGEGDGLVTISKPKNSCKELRFLAEKSMPKSVLR